jgi:hypothetical protein
MRAAHSLLFRGEQLELLQAMKWLATLQRHLQSSKRNLHVRQTDTTPASMIDAKVAQH